MAIIAEAPEVVSHLEGMGIPLTALTRAVATGAGGFNSTTRFHPRSGPGTYLYQEATAALRRVLESVGDWDFDEDDRQPRTYSAARRISIVVQTGDENTGVDTGTEPKTRNPKGAATFKKISSNSEQLSLFSPAPAVLPSAEDGQMLTWILLVAIVDDTVRAELSLPSGWTPGGKPCGWHLRILLPEQDLGGGAQIDLSDPIDGAGLSTDIDVEWKQ